jgi:Family of unknown function (DUF5994)
MSVATVPRETLGVLEKPAPAKVSSGSVLRARGWPLRLSLSPSIGSGALDGAWWPYSHDLRVEAVGLADALPSSLGRVLRVIYCPADWTSGPGRVKADNVVVTLASFPGDDNTGRVLLRTDCAVASSSCSSCRPSLTIALRATRCGSPPAPAIKSRPRRSWLYSTTSCALDCWATGTTTADIPRLGNPLAAWRPNPEHDRRHGRRATKTHRLDAPRPPTKRFRKPPTLRNQGGSTSLIGPGPCDQLPQPGRPRGA